MTGKLHTREIMALISITIGMKFTDMTATLLFNQTGPAGWMVPILSSLVLLLPISCTVYLLGQFSGEDIISISYSLAGKAGGFITGILLFSIAFFSTVINSRSYADIISTLYFPETHLIYNYAVLIGASYLLASAGVQAIGRTSWFHFFIIKGVTLSILFLVWKELTFSHLFPIMGYGLGPLLKESMIFTSITGDLFFFSILYPYARSYKSFKKAMITGYFLVIMELAVFLAVYIAYFDFPSFMYITYPFHELLRLLTFGRYISNVEAIFFAFWVIAAVIRFSVYLYVCSGILASTFSLKTGKPILLPLCVITVLLGTIPENNIINVLFFRQSLIIWSSVVLFIIPLFLLVLYKWKKEKKKYV